MGLFSLIGGLIGSGSAKKASRRAEAAQLGYLNRGIDEQRRQFDVTRADYAPYLAAGTEALQQQGNLVGLGEDGVQAAAIERLRASPYFQSLLQSGEEGLLQNAAATGGLRGGNIQRGLADFRADLLAQTIERQLGHLGGLSGRGQDAVGSISAFGANRANNVTSLLANQGAVRAGGLLTRGGINASNWRNLGSFVDQAIEAAMGAGAGPGGAPFSLSSFANNMGGKVF